MWSTLKCWQMWDHDGYFDCCPENGNRNGNMNFNGWTVINTCLRINSMCLILRYWCRTAIINIQKSQIRYLLEHLCSAFISCQFLFPDPNAESLRAKIVLMTDPWKGIDIQLKNAILTTEDKAILFRLRVCEISEKRNRIVDPSLKKREAKSHCPFVVAIWVLMDRHSNGVWAQGLRNPFAISRLFRN
jgi:hypothetical protein